LILAPAIIQKRDMNNADIVTFVTKSFNCKNCPGGLAPLAPNPLSFLHVIRYDLLFSSTGQVFSHEIGHLFGCRHQIQSDPNGTFEHAHKNIYDFRRVKNTYKHTIMWSHYYALSPYHHILYYSNPDVKYYNKAIGKDNHDNARKIDETSHILANFKTTNSYPEVIIAGKNYDCPGKTISLSAIVNGVSSNYQLE